MANTSPVGFGCGVAKWLLDSVFNPLAKMSELWTEEVNFLLDEEVPD